MYFYLVGIYIVQWIVNLEIINIKYYLKNKTIKSSLVYLSSKKKNLESSFIYSSSPCQIVLEGSHQRQKEDRVISLCYSYSFDLRKRPFKFKVSQNFCLALDSTKFKTYTNAVHLNEYLDIIFNYCMTYKEYDSFLPCIKK